MNGMSQVAGMDSAGVFAVKIATLLDEDRADDALANIHDDANEEVVSNACLELFSVIGERMNKGDLLTERPDQWDYMQSMLEYLTKICKPKEVLIALLELLEIVSGDAMFHLVLLLLKIAFLRLPDRRGTEFVWALCSTIDYLHKLPPPPAHNLDDDEMVALENCVVSRRLEQCVMTALMFCDPFVSEARHCSRTNDKVRRRRSLHLTCFLLKLLERPIADFEIGDSDKMGFTAPFSECANRIVDLLIDLFPDLLQLHFIINSGELNMECQLAEEKTMMVDMMCLGVLEFLMQLGGRGRRNQLSIYSNEFIFDACLPSCVALCQKSGQRGSVAMARKGVTLFESLLQYIPEGAWPREQLSVLCYQEAAFSLLTIMQHCPLLALRQRALRCLERFVRTFDDPGQLAFIRLMFHDLDRPGSTKRDNTKASNFLGWLIDFFRNRLAKSSSVDFCRETPSMISMFCFLPEAEQTDLLERRDLYLAALNFSRFVGLSQRRLNLSVGLFKGLNESFVQPFGKALELSSAHYKLELANGEREEEAARADNRTLDDLFFSRMDLCHNAVLTYDLMYSLLSHVSEVVGTILDAQERVN